MVNSAWRANFLAGNIEKTGRDFIVGVVELDLHRLAVGFAPKLFFVLFGFKEPLSFFNFGLVGSTVSLGDNE